MSTNIDRRQAFLDMIAFSEGTSTHPMTKNDGYDVIVTGHGGDYEIFSDYKQHPFSNGRKPKKIRDDLLSTASGRYQFLVKHWVHYRDTLKLPDFGPRSQDTWAIQLIRECGALSLVDNGFTSEAVTKVRRIWASLPGAGYGQPEHSLEDLLGEYDRLLAARTSTAADDASVFTNKEDVAIPAQDNAAIPIISPFPAKGQQCMMPLDGITISAPRGSLNPPFLNRIGFASPGARPDPIGTMSTPEWSFWGWQIFPRRNR